MYRAIIVVILFLVNPSLWVVAQDEIIPFAYVTEPADHEVGFPNFDLYVMNLQNGEIIFKSTTLNKECPLAISPDGKSFLYQQQFSQDEQVKFAHYFVDLTTGDQHEIDLGNHLLQRAIVMWPTNNGKFYFIVQKYADNRIYEYDLTTDTLSEVVRSEPFIAMMQLGTDLVYWSANDKDLTINDFNGNSYELLYSELFSMGRPSPDGRYIVREVNKEQYLDDKGLVLYQYDYLLSGLNDSDFITISDAQRGEYQIGLSWRSDSQAVFYYDLDENFVVYDLALRQKMLFPAPDFTGLRDLSFYGSPDRRYIVYLIDHGLVSHQDQNELGLIDTVTGDISKISSYNDPDGQTGFIRWVNNDQFVYFRGNYGGNVVVSEQRAVDIMKYDITTDVYTNLTDTPNLTERMDCWYG